MTPPFPLSVVIPAYNEEARISKTLNKILDWRPSVFDPIEILVVDDGSVDATKNVVKRFMLQDPRIGLIEAPHGGQMHACLAGFRAAKHPFVGTLDADGATNPSEFERLAPHINQSDVLVGSRLLRGDLPPIEGKGLLRRALSFGFSYLFLLFFRCHVRDPQIGFKIFKRKVLEDTVPLLSAKHDGIKLAEMLVKAYGLGYSIKEIPVLYHHDPNSRSVSVLPFGIVVGVLTALFGIWINASRQYRRGLLPRLPVRANVLVAIMDKITGRGP